MNRTASKAKSRNAMVTAGERIMAGPKNGNWPTRKPIDPKMPSPGAYLDTTSRVPEGLQANCGRDGEGEDPGRAGPSLAPYLLEYRELSEPDEGLEPEVLKDNRQTEREEKESRGPPAAAPVEERRDEARKRDEEGRYAGVPAEVIPVAVRRERSEEEPLPVHLFVKDDRVVRLAYLREARSSLTK